MENGKIEGQEKQDLIDQIKAEAKAKAESKSITVVVDNSKYAMILDTGKFLQLQRVASLFASSDLVPDSFRGKPANCFIALQVAVRLDIDPFMLLQNSYAVHGKLGLESKLLIALVNQSGSFKTELNWRYEGQGDTRRCTAYAIHKDGDMREKSVDMAMVRKMGWMDKPNSFWVKMPDEMLAYRSAAFFARAFCPGAILGLYSKDELQDIEAGNHIDIAPTKTVEVKVETPEPPKDENSDVPDFTPAARAVRNIVENLPTGTTGCTIQIQDHTKRRGRPRKEPEPIWTAQLERIEAQAKQLGWDDVNGQLGNQIVLITGETPPCKPSELTTDQANVLLAKMEAILNSRTRGEQ